MSDIFQDYEPDQSLLFPPSPRDWLPEDHLVWFVADTVDALDIEGLLSKYRPGGKGNLAYHPRMMLKILIYAYCTGVFSSRKIARQIEENVAFRVLAAGHCPNHRTICRFREMHLDEFQALFVQVVQIALEAGLVKMGTVALDGSKVKANASKHKAMSYKRMQEEEARLAREIRELTKRARSQDAAEDEMFGPDFRGDELPEEMRRRQSRLAKIREARQRLEERKRVEAEQQAAARDRADTKKSKRGKRTKKKRGQPRVQPEAEPQPKDQENFTDGDSRIMKKGSSGFEQCYNTGVVVDGCAQIIVATGVTQNASDVQQLIPLIDKATANTEQQPEKVLADAGYRSEANFVEMEARGVKGYVPLGREGKDVPSSDPSRPATKRMGRRMQGKRGRKTYKQRKHIVEPVFGWIKQVLGFRSFSLRSLRKVTGEWDLVCLAVNLMRMNRMIVWR